MQNKRKNEEKTASASLATQGLFQAATASVRPLPIICIGQAVLMLIEYYQKFPDLKDKLALIKKLYLTGIQNATDQTTLSNLLNEAQKLGLFKNVFISKAFEDIQKDPVRRYFETHLAYETLRENVPLLDINSLRTHKEDFYNYARETQEIFEIDYKSSFQCIKNKSYFPFCSDGDREKLEYLLLCALGTFHYPDFSLANKCYHTGYYKPESRGRDVKACNSLSNNFGIMTMHMPTPNTAIDRISDQAVKKVCDKYQPDYQCEWPLHNFNQLFHPFVSSISGTFLVQLASIHRLSLKTFNDVEKLASYIKCFISLLLYMSGIHSLHEFTAVLLLDEVAQAFAKVPNFSEINLVSLFYNEAKESAFEQALQDTIKYNKVMIAKIQLHDDINHPELKTSTRWLGRLGGF